MIGTVFSKYDCLRAEFNLAMPYTPKNPIATIKTMHAPMTAMILNLMVPAKALMSPPSKAMCRGKTEPAPATYSRKRRRHRSM
jgi:hypothetical protein